MSSYLPTQLCNIYRIVQNAHIHLTESTSSNSVPIIQVYEYMIEYGVPQKDKTVNPMYQLPQTRIEKIRYFGNLAKNDGINYNGVNV